MRIYDWDEKKGKVEDLMTVANSSEFPSLPEWKLPISLRFVKAFSSRRTSKMFSRKLSRCVNKLWYRDETAHSTYISKHSLSACPPQCWYWSCTSPSRAASWTSCAMRARTLAARRDYQSHCFVRSCGGRLEYSWQTQTRASLMRS